MIVQPTDFDAGIRKLVVEVTSQHKVLEVLYLHMFQQMQQFEKMVRACQLFYQVHTNKGRHRVRLREKLHEVFLIPKTHEMPCKKVANEYS